MDTTPHNVRRFVPVVAVLVIAIMAVSGCGNSTSDADLAAANAAKVKETKKKPKKVLEKFFDESGVPLAAKAEVLGEPVPKKTFTVTADPTGAAGFSSRHKYNDLVNFYKEKLGEEYKGEDRRGGVRFTSTDGKKWVFVLKPSAPGRDPRVMYFNYSDDKGAIPQLSNPNATAERERRAALQGGAQGNRAGSGGGNGLSTRTGALNDASGNKGANGGGGARGDAASKAGAPANGGSGSGGMYNRTIERDKDGKEFVVLTPKEPARPTSLGVDDRKRGDGNGTKSAGRFRLERPKDIQF